MQQSFILDILIFIIVLGFAYIYVQIARKFKIYDAPNERSSHAYFPVRGGGILFPVAIISWFVLDDQTCYYFITGLIILSVISFADDLQHLHFGIRICFQSVAIGLLIMQFSQGELHFPYVVFYFLVLLYFMNAYNFMDGINGITGCYSLVALFTLLYINYESNALDEQMAVYLFVSILVFLIFNFRRKALFFAGDVGSMSIAYVISFLLLHTIFKTNSFQYLIIFSLYFIDTGFTIIQRILNKENIFTAHRQHLYQILSNEYKIPQLFVSIIYMGLQAVSNGIFLYSGAHLSMAIVLLIIFIFVYSIVKLALHKKMFGYYLLK